MHCQQTMHALLLQIRQVKISCMQFGRDIGVDTYSRGVF